MLGLLRYLTLNTVIGVVIKSCKVKYKHSNNPAALR
jgi:hypothetical protein